MTSEGIGFLITAAGGFLSFDYLLIFSTRKPQNSQKLLGFMQQLPGPFWTRNTEAGGIILVLIYVLFLYYLSKPHKSHAFSSKNFVQFT